MQEIESISKQKLESELTNLGYEKVDLEWIEYWRREEASKEYEHIMTFFKQFMSLEGVIINATEDLKLKKRLLERIQEEIGQLKVICVVGSFWPLFYFNDLKVRDLIAIDINPKQIKYFFELLKDISTSPKATQKIDEMIGLIKSGRFTILSDDLTGQGSIQLINNLDGRSFNLIDLSNLGDYLDDDFFYQVLLNYLREIKVGSIVISSKDYSKLTVLKERLQANWKLKIEIEEDPNSKAEIRSFMIITKLGDTDLAS